MALTSRSDQPEAATLGQPTKWTCVEWESEVEGDVSVGVSVSLMWRWSFSVATIGVSSGRNG